MGQAELLIAGLLVAVAGLGALARRLSVPYPIVLVVGGALFGFVPGLPEVRLDPEVVLVVFLPPLLYGASIFANFNDLRANLRALTLTTVGLVLATMCAVAWAAHTLIAGLPWEAAFVLGAIVSPTDPLAAAAIMRRLDAPRRLVSAVEGEGLFNDATALVAYRFAVAAVVAGSFSLADAGLKFVLGAAGGVAIGIAVGWIVAEIRKRTTDAQVSVTISLLTGYAAFVPADAIGASGILATVTAGIYMGIRGPQILPARTRLQGYFVWDILDFIINATLFVLIGLQLRAVVDGLSGYSASTLGGYALAVTGVVVGTRLVWFFTVPYLIRAIDRRPAESDQGRDRADRRTGRRGVDARRDDRAAPQVLRVPQAPLRGPRRQDRGRRLRGPLARLPADGPGRTRCAAGRAGEPAQRGHDLERGDEPRGARLRPRGVAARDLSLNARGRRARASRPARR
jgi:monovalent cation/hydrogen antiporter